jgi:hypothetical protein
MYISGTEELLKLLTLLHHFKAPCFGKYQLYKLK